MDNKFRQALVSLERRQTMVTICRLVAWGLLIGDGLFTFFTLALGGNNLFAVCVAAAVAAMQWAIANAIYHRHLGQIFHPDHNKDGKTTFAEWTRFAIIIGSVVTAYFVDWSTNTAGIDAINTGMMLRVPWVSEQAPATLSWLLAAVLMLADETIHFFCDMIQAEIDEQRPKLRRRAAQQAFAADVVSAYEVALLPRAKDIGTKQGQRENPDHLN